MQSLLLAVYLTVVLGLFVAPVQNRLRAWFRRGSARIFLVPAALWGLFGIALAAVGGWSSTFMLLLAGYVLLPTLLVASGRAWLDFAAILALWLPVEFTTGKELLAQSAWNIANVAARGTAIVLALALFLLFRDLKGMKYNLPSRWRDLTNPLIGFAVTFPILMILGLALNFMGPFRMPTPFHPLGFGVLFLKTVLGVAIPEELLFRGLIQNWLMQRFGFNHRTLFVAALIFGASHLNNPPGPLPNWHYMILATIAGFIYGKVFWKSSTILSSAGLHALVNAVRHTFFL